MLNSVIDFSPLGAPGYPQMDRCGYLAVSARGAGLEPRQRFPGFGAARICHRVSNLNNTWTTLKDNKRATTRNSAGSIGSYHYYPTIYLLSARSSESHIGLPTQSLLQPSTPPKDSPTTVHYVPSIKKKRQRLPAKIHMCYVPSCPPPNHVCRLTSWSRNPRPVSGFICIVKTPRQRDYAPPC